MAHPKTGTRSHHTVKHDTVEKPNTPRSLIIKNNSQPTQTPNKNITILITNDMCRVTNESSPINMNEFAALLRFLTKNSTPTKPSRKRVRFSAQVCTSGPSNISRDEVASMWYDAQTITGFKNNARKIVFSGTLERPQQNQDTRGLESCTYARQLHRHKINQCILKAHKQGMTAEQTAAIAEQCSAWNRDIAALQACHDFFEVHQPDMALAEICNTPPAFPFDHKRSCASQEQQQQQRRVRRRIV